MRTQYPLAASVLVSLSLALAAAPLAAAGDADSMLDSTYRSLVAEHKASRVGDVLTVVVHEAASASSTADLRRERNFTFSGQAGTDKVGPYSATASTDTASDGFGRTQRTGKLLAQISVRVVALKANGDLVVAGEQSLRINGEEQLITLSGVVRPRDISESNIVLSSRIADALIRFDGEGFVTDQSKPGWLARIFNFLGL